MSKPKFTPGPWSKELDAAEYAIYINDKDGNSICKINLPEGNDDANARLIAAAPSLYEALADVKEGFAGRGNDGSKELLVKVHAAIALVEGKS